MKLATHMVEKPWGRHDLPAAFGVDPALRIGEVWFDAPDAPLPVLIKWLFTSERLSIQVHPNDHQANERGLPSGKDECWYVVAAQPDATLGIGTQQALTSAELLAAVQDGSLEQLMDWKPVRSGDCFFIPAGTVHAIGPDVTIVEVQQNADLTYRLYDYGRPRELHLEDGIAVSDARPYDVSMASRVGDDPVQLLVDCTHFRLFHARGEAIAALSEEQNCAHWIIPLSGSVRAGGESASAGQCLYFTQSVTLSVDSNATALIALEGQA